MKNTFKNISIVFTAGAVGAFTNSVVLVFIGKSGLHHVLDVNISPELTAVWLYPRLVWGALWGFLFLLPNMQKSIYIWGCLYSCIPTLVQLLIVFPFKLEKGMLGVELGNLTPLIVILVNVIWGVSAAAWIDQATRKAR